MGDDLFLPLTPANAAAVAPKCRHPKPWLVHPPTGGWICRIDGCGHLIAPDAPSRGKNNRARGNYIEREIGKRLGLRRVGQYGGPEDLTDELFSAQVKSGLSFPERLWGWLKQVPVRAGQTALLVITDAPGPGRRRRALVVLDIDDWMALHGRDSDAGIQPVDPYLEGRHG